MVILNLQFVYMINNFFKFHIKQILCKKYSFSAEPFFCDLFKFLDLAIHLCDYSTLSTRRFLELVRWHCTKQYEMKGAQTLFLSFLSSPARWRRDKICHFSYRDFLVPCEPCITYNTRK